MPKWYAHASSLGEIGVKSSMKKDPHETQGQFSGKTLRRIHLMVSRYPEQAFSAENVLYGTPVMVTVLGRPKVKYFEVDLVMSWEPLVLSNDAMRSFCKAISKALEPHIAPLTLFNHKKDRQGVISVQTLELSGGAL